MIEEMKNLKENISQEAAVIHAMLQTGQQSAQDFIDNNNVDAKKLIDYIKQYKGEPRENIIKDVITGNVRDYNPQSLKAFKSMFLKKITNESMKINELGGPVPKADIDITYVGAPNNIDDDKIIQSTSQIKQAVEKILYDVFKVPINLVKVKFNGENPFPKAPNSIMGMKVEENLENYIREIVKKKLAENQPAPSRENPDRETIERGTEEEKEKKRRRIGNPDVEPKPKATMNENEKEVLKQIVDRFKQSRGK